MCLYHKYMYPLQNMHVYIHVPSTVHACVHPCVLYHKYMYPLQNMHVYIHVPSTVHACVHPCTLTVHACVHPCVSTIHACTLYSISTCIYIYLCTMHYKKFSFLLLNLSRQAEGYSSLPVCVCVCMSVCLLPLDLHNCKVVLHFEYINRKLLLRLPGKNNPIVLKLFCCKDITV